MRHPAFGLCHFRVTDWRDSTDISAPLDLTYGSGDIGAGAVVTGIGGIPLPPSPPTGSAPPAGGTLTGTGSALTWQYGPPVPPGLLPFYESPIVYGTGGSGGSKGARTFAFFIA